MIKSTEKVTAPSLFQRKGERKRRSWDQRDLDRAMGLIASVDKAHSGELEKKGGNWQALNITGHCRPAETSHLGSSFHNYDVTLT